MSLGENIRITRSSIGMTQEKLANLCGVHVQSVRNWEKGSVPRPEMLARIADALGSDVDDLTGTEPEIEPIPTIPEMIEALRERVADELMAVKDRISIVVSYT